MKIAITILAVLLLQFNAFNQDLVRGPYLQSLAPTSIKVLWRTSEPSISNIQISASVGGPILQTVTGTEEAVDHIALVQGLTAGNTYYYRIGADDEFLTEWNEMYRFKTIPSNTTSTSFWATGDFGAKNQRQIDVRNAFVSYVDGDYPDFWLWLGDNAYDDGKDFEYQERVFTPPYGYDQLLPFLPFYPVPGNHDYNSVNLLSPPPQHRGPYFNVIEVPTQGEAGGVPSGTELYYSFDYGDVHFVAINSEAFAYTFFANSKMSDWLRADLAASDKLWKVAFWHQPPYSKGSHDSDEFYEVFMKAMRKNYNPIIEEFGVDLVLCGHSHVYERTALIKGHFGGSASFNSNNVIDGEQPYMKYLDGDKPNHGTVYTVVGNSGKSEGNPEGIHPAFVTYDYGSDAVGSLLVNVEGNTLNGKYIRGDGSIYDEFTIIKGLQDSSVITGVVDSYLDDIKLFPNPSKNLLNLQFSIKKPTSVEFLIYDESGKTCYKEETVRYSVGNHTKRIQMSDYNLPSGNYILKMGVGEGKRSWKSIKFVKIE
jgi:hypothetical protein